MQVTLKAARINAGLTQRDAARKIGITVDTLGNWERGKSFPTVVQLPIIEQIYTVKYDDIIFLPQNNA